MIQGLTARRSTGETRQDDPTPRVARGCRVPRRRHAHRATWVAVTLTLTLSALAFPAPTEAASFTCVITTSGVPACTYTGPVRFTYANENGSVLLFWDASITAAQVQAEAASVGLEAPDYVLFEAAALNATATPDFAAFAYATMLTAQVSGAEVGIQMRPPSYSGRLRIDRIHLRTE